MTTLLISVIFIIILVLVTAILAVNLKRKLEHETKLYQEKRLEVPITINRR